jgi:hypothetical protein
MHTIFVQDKNYVILITYNQSNTITCLKCKAKLFLNKNNKVAFIYLENMNAFKKEQQSHLGSNPILKRDLVFGYVPMAVSTKFETFNLETLELGL